MIDTHCHLDGEEFAQDLETVITRAREAGVEAIGVPGIDLKSCQTVACSHVPFLRRMAIRRGLESESARWMKYWINEYVFDEREPPSKT